VNTVLIPVAGLLADNGPRNGPDFGKASPFGLLIVALLLIGTFFLVRSMNRHLRKLPKSFDRDDPGPDQATDDATVDPDTKGSPEPRAPRQEKPDEPGA
jgi:hypothetical protein